MSSNGPLGDTLRVSSGNLESLIDTAVAGVAAYGDLNAFLAQPIFVVSAPRSGSTMLFEQLMTVEGLWSIGGESHGIFRLFPGLRAENANLDSGSLSAAHADDKTANSLRACFAWLLRNHHGQPLNQMSPELRPQQATLIEKTPRNALNIPFIQEVFPDARFIYLHREPRANIASIVEAWAAGLQSGRFVTFRDLPGWDRPGWCFLLPSGWRECIGRSLFDIAAFQWAASNDAILDALPAERSCMVSYESLVEDPQASIASVCEFAGVLAPNNIAAQLPLSRTTISRPASDKWRRYEKEIAAVESLYAPTAQRIRVAAVRS